MSKSYKLSLPSALKPGNNLLAGNRFRYTDASKLSNNKSKSRKLSWYRTVLDSGSEIVLKWNWVFIVSCMVALLIDPLYLFVPTIGGNVAYPCARTDTSLRILVTFFRTVFLVH
ncbi:unnamed protein product [Microthlaspi erraticum]|uniref:Ion transport domain-containing protein n=1 Tax=Microthlaspi erraticum TaxID=1685480 RepID=A0A6D2IWJ3_9BRAS|nr:unnamed protein product [Microthlaspi erraticum]